MMPLPQTSSYNDPLTVLICGGSTPNGVALDNCVHIQPEVANPTWVVERMVSCFLLGVTASDEHAALEACVNLHG
jgi:hypothetical protein